MDYIYDIGQFFWNKEKNTFYADAWNLITFLQDGSMHPEAFANGKQQFYIKNYKTDQFRRFTFVKEQVNTPTLIIGVNEESEFSYPTTDWVFESECGIKCVICVSEGENYL